jgi:long-chain acyl-CoA synthetase
VDLSPVFAVYPIETIRDLLFAVCKRYAGRSALKVKKEGVYQSLTYTELRESAEELGTAVAAMGLRKGDRVGIIGDNCPEWAVSYLAVVSLGLVAVPIDRDLKQREIHHILGVAGVRMLIGGPRHLALLQEDLGEVKGLQFIVTMGDQPVGSGLTFPEALEKGRAAMVGGDRSFAEATVAPDDLAVLIFTSGTTGASKGVMLTHRNIASNVVGTSCHVAINHDDVLLSVLPLHHTYEATAGFLTALYQGATICYAESLRRVADNLRETKASVMLGVPALFEAMYRRIHAGIEEKGAGKFALAKGVASISELVLRRNVRRTVFRKLHERFGGALRLMISGGAAINPAVSRGYRELGIDFIQGYGLTEYSPIVSVNRVDSFKDGSVGHPLPGAEIRIVEDEIVVRGPCVMKGYFKNDAATSDAIRDGWLFTGDLGNVDKAGFLHITGRKKSVVVTPNGKNVYPEELEALLSESPFVLECLVWGGPENDPSLTEVQALIVPNTQEFDQSFGPDQYDEAKITDVISAEVRKANKELANYKRIKKFVIRHEEFEKTTTRKIKRYLYTQKPTPIKKKRWH